VPEKPNRYPNPPRRAFRAMGLGKLIDGHIKVVAGFRFLWWDPEGRTIPLVVNARVLRLKGQERQ
jgi:hypothetical protein